MRIMILNAEAGGNKGAEAMLETLIIKLSEKFTSKITLVLEVASNFEYYNNVFLKRFATKNLNFELIAFKPRNILNPYGNKLGNLDVAIDIGGINFHDGSKRAHLRNLVRYLPLFKQKVKLIFFTQDIGPSKQLFTKIIGRKILKKATAVFTRSEISYNTVIDYFKIDKNIVFGPFPDATLLYNTNDVSIYKPKEDSYVILSPSAIMYVKHGDAYLDLFVKLYEQLKSEYKVIGLVHNFTKNDGSSDSHTLKLINERLNEEMIIINENVSTGELKALLAKSKFVISSRYHVVVGAITKNVPAIAIGWNPKYASFLSLYGKKEWNIDFNIDSIKEVSAILRNNTFIESESILNKINVGLRRKVETSFDKLMSLITN